MKKITKAMEKFAASIVAPEGFTKEVLRDVYAAAGNPVEKWGGTDDRQQAGDYKGCLAVIVKSETRAIVFNIGMEDIYKAGRKRGQAVSAGGHTIFKNPRGFWSNFDRIGVSDSFYITRYDEGVDADPNAVLARELERVEKYLVADESRISVPVIGHRITPERKAQDIAALKAGKNIRYMPSGFGTGYIFTATARKGWGRPADTRLRAFFECPTLMVETQDCD